MDKLLTVLSDSLDQKILVLKEIRNYNEQQRMAFENQEADLDSFDDAIAKKEELIQKVLQLDNGFESIYQKLAGALEENKGKYISQIVALQEKIKKVTDLSVEVQTQEARNKKLVESYFAKAREDLGERRRNARVAQEFYKNLNGYQNVQSRTYDSKQ